VLRNVRGRFVRESLSLFLSPLLPHIFRSLSSQFPLTNFTHLRNLNLTSLTLNPTLAYSNHNQTSVSYSHSRHILPLPSTLSLPPILAVVSYASLNFWPFSTTLSISPSVHSSLSRVNSLYRFNHVAFEPSPFWIRSPQQQKINYLSIKTTMGNWHLSLVLPYI